MRKFSRKLVVTAVAALMLVTAGVAFAAWLVSGTGTADASAANVSPLNVTVTSNLTGLYPNAKKDLVLRIENPNSFPVTVTGVNATVTGGNNACAASNVTVNAVLPATPILLSAGGVLTDVTFDDAVTMAADAPIACAGQPFSVAVTVEGTSPS